MFPLVGCLFDGGGGTQETAHPGKMLRTNVNIGTPSFRDQPRDVRCKSRWCDRKYVLTNSQQSSLTGHVVVVVPSTRRLRNTTTTTMTGAWERLGTAACPSSLWWGLLATQTHVQTRAHEHQRVSKSTKSRRKREKKGNRL